MELETLTRKCAHHFHGPSCANTGLGCRYTQHAVKFMEHNRERPFLLYVAYNEVSCYPSFFASLRPRGLNACLSAQVHHPSFSSDEVCLHDF